MSSNDDLPKKGKKKKIMRDIFGRKRQRMNESSDDEEDAEDFIEKFDAEDLMKLIDSGENREYRSVPVNLNLTDEAGVPVEFEELVLHGQPMGFVQCKTLNCPSKKDSKVRYGHFKPHAIDTKSNRTRLYQKALFERHITRWHKSKVTKSSSSQPKLGQKFGFKAQLTQKFKKTYKQKTMKLLAKKGLPLNFCEDESFKVKLIIWPRAIFCSCFGFAFLTF